MQPSIRGLLDDLEEIEDLGQHAESARSLLEFHERVRRGYLESVRPGPSPTILVASGSIDDVALLATPGAIEEVEVNLVDRGKFEHPLLVGRSFLSQGVLVDSAARHRVPPACDKRGR